MTVSRRTIVGSEARNRERWGGLPWTVSSAASPARRSPWFGHALAFAIGIALAVFLLRSGA